MWKIMRKCLAVCLSMLVVLSAINMTVPLGVSAATNDKGIQAKIDIEMKKINAEFSNGIFSVNGKNCYTSGTNHACSNCNLYTILSKRLNENLNTWKTKTGDGYQCNAFARYLFVRVFGSCKETEDRSNIGSARSASTYSSLKKGDIFQTANHWMIYLSHDSQGVNVIDANGAGDLKIRITKYSYSSGNLSGNVLQVWHSKNWDKVNNEYMPVVSTSNCNEYWTINDTQGVNLRSSYGTDSSVKCVVPNKTQLHVTKKTSSKVNGYTWGYVTYKSNTGWIALELAKRTYLTQTISGPASSYTKTCGDNAFSLGASTNGNGSLSYSSSDSGVAGVDSSGKVTIYKAGTTTITINASATSAYQKASKNVTIIVKAATQTITGPASSYTKTVGDASFYLNAKASGNVELSYASSNSDVVSVDGEGLVTVVGEGSATITITAQATATYAQSSKEVSITVKAAPKQEARITVEKTSYIKTVGDESFRLNATTSSDGVISYSSSNPTVATVDNNGIVSIHEAGEAVLTISSSETDQFLEAKKEVSIQVNEKSVVPTGLSIHMDDVRVSPGGNGKIPVRMTNSSGIFGLNLTLLYDESVMEVTAITPGNIFAENEMSESNIRNGKIYIAGQASELKNIEGDGVVAYIEFNMKSSVADGEYEITPESSFVFNVEEEELACNLTGGKITVKAYIPGDVNSDGKVNGLDVLRLRKYLAGWNVECNLAAADVTGDGKVNGIDVLRIRKFLAGWDVVLQ